jgi:hypothetical protein
MPNDSRLVDLLRDAKGIYGIGILHDDLIEEESARDKHLIFRSDVIAESAFPVENREILLHTLPKHSFMSTYEWNLHGVMLAEALKRNPRYQEFEVKLYEDREEIEAGDRGGKPWPTGEEANLYRKIRWGQHKRQLINLNGMLKRVIAEAAEPNALKLARRFHPLVRENVYRGAATSQRALQLIDTFPVLGLVIYCTSDEWRDRTSDAVKMVDRGARLNEIASFMDIPMWTRNLKPAVAHWFGHVPKDLHCYLPEKTWEQRLWLRAFMSRGAEDPDFTYWIARNVLKVGNRIGPVLNFLGDMNDWVMEAKRKKPRCIIRPFSPDMSINTVRTELWHEAIAVRKAAKSKYKIPTPWYPADEVNGYQIVPLDSAEELWKEGRAMHHCVGAYDYRVAAGKCYMYSVRLGDNRLATVELVRKKGEVRPLQIRAACNGKPPKEVKSAVKKWVSELKAA